MKQLQSLLMVKQQFWSRVKGRSDTSAAFSPFLSTSRWVH